MKKILAIDGHDGVGKTAVARAIASAYAVEYRKPFADSLGDLIAYLYRTGKFNEADHVARLAIEKMVEESPENVTVCSDRNWLSLFTVLPDCYFEGWGKRPHTVLLTASLDVVATRLSQKGEVVGDLDEHAFFLQRYVELARRFNISIIDTSNLAVEDAMLLVAHAFGLAR